MFRIEKDSLGEKQIPSDALYGIHALRAKENFPINLSFPIEWYKSMGITKLACYRTYQKFIKAAHKKSGRKISVKEIDNKVIEAMISSSTEISEGKFFEYFIVPALQGGAGTSINMNVNEIVTNSALMNLGNKCGDYAVIDPLEHANIFQSTNDVVPTALTIAVMRLLLSLENHINRLRQKVEEFEKAGRNSLRPGYTQMQQAVPSSFGLLFGTYNEALSRDWWRVSKCSERAKPINLGGGAIGTGLSVPRFFIMEIVPELRKLTGLQLTHSENLADTTSNLDKWVEIHAILKAHAVNLEKIVSDIRLLSSDLAGEKLLSIPEKQVGSSIMPGKINPVIPEFVISASHKVYANDLLITSLSGQGCLELNAYLPLIGVTIIESLNLLISSDISLLQNLFNGLEFNNSAGYNSLIRSPAVTTALIPYIGYHKAGDLAKLMKDKNIDVFEADSILNIIGKNKIRSILDPSNLLKLGFSLDDLL